MLDPDRAMLRNAPDARENLLAAKPDHPLVVETCGSSHVLGINENAQKGWNEAGTHVSAPRWTALEYGNKCGAVRSGVSLDVRRFSCVVCGQQAVKSLCALRSQVRISHERSSLHKMNETPDDVTQRAGCGGALQHRGHEARGVDNHLDGVLEKEVGNALECGRRLLALQVGALHRRRRRGGANSFHGCRSIACIRLLEKPPHDESVVR
mmetsp:Transcript_4090/g.10669  ORF Transcript_4090/g.10669 Transcript_4090/m.10669 type:complete len:209 (+) Transcript_4090:1018-1644(+)